MPIRQKRFLLVLVDTLSVIGLDLELSFAADVVKVRLNCTDLRSAAGDFTMTSGVRRTVRAIWSICA
jgi:hypothetical protein